LIIGRGRSTGATLLIAFSIGGAVSYGLMRFVYARAKTQGVPRILSEGSSRPVLGIAGGLVAGAFGLAYLFAIGSAGLLDEASKDSQSFASLGLWAIPLAIIAAPVFEEFIFRGLIFGGLRRSFGVWPATLASAAVFAILHPALAIAPVFVMGACAALVYDRTRSLLAPMIVHAVYNACVITVPALFI
jgi:membrane protease YdiL (CAAX protease family)